MNGHGSAAAVQPIEESALARLSVTAQNESLYPARPDWTPMTTEEDSVSVLVYQEELRWSEEAENAISTLQKSALYLRPRAHAGTALARWGDKFIESTLATSSLASLSANPAFFPPQIWRGGRQSANYVTQWRSMRLTSKRKQSKAEQNLPHNTKQIRDWTAFETADGQKAEEDKPVGGYNEEEQEREDVLSDPDQFEDDEDDDYGQNYFDPGEEDEVDDMGGMNEGEDYD